MRLRTSILGIGSVVMLLGCAADAVRDVPRATNTPAPTPAGMQPMPAGTSGDFGNAMQTAPRAGSVATMAMPRPRANCTGGLYLGMYQCDLDFAGIMSPLEGDVSFNLEIDTSVVPGECDAEFCPDLVIAEGSGTLFGLADGFGFEAELSGGLDCQTGEFRASAPNGIWGLADSSDPSDPEALWTVLDPAFGEFTGTLTGTYGSGPPEAIAGSWDLTESGSGIRCPGPFMVALQP